MNQSEFEKGDKVWCIAENDESESYNLSPSGKEYTPPKQMEVVKTEPVVATIISSDGMPDMDPNTRVTFYSASPNRYLYHRRVPAWRNYLQNERKHLISKLRSVSEDLDKLDDLERALQMGWDDEGLMLVSEMGVSLEKAVELTDNEVTDE